MDVAIESHGEVIALYSRCAVLRVDPGVPALGDFYIEHDAHVIYTDQSSDLRHDVQKLK